MGMSSEKLRDLFNLCISRNQVPSLWTMSTLVAVPKPGKPLRDPKSYRIISLNSCVSKVMTLLMDRRLREFFESVKLLPDSQNGFREGYRTSNNAFVLRHCIERARAEKKCLIVLSIDLKNAFPSTNLSSLWAKFYDIGARGPVIDWLRRFYEVMLYRVKVGEEYSDAFESAWGIMAGDSISPALFLAFTYDFDPPLSMDDILLQDVHIAKLAFADDVVFILLTDAKQPRMNEMQRRLTWAEIEYCGKSVFLEMNAVKSLCCLIGAKEVPSEPLTANNGGQAVAYVGEFRYTGVHISSDIRDPFQPHYKAWSAKARAAIYNVFSTETFVGTIPAPTGIRLYFAMVDPYLIFGCEVVINVNEKSLRMYESAQQYYIRRLLGLQPRCPVCVLHVLTSIPPIRHRQIDLQLRYALYAIIQPDNHYENRAYRDSITMHRAGKRSWITDLGTAMNRLPAYPVALDVDLMETEDGIATLREKVRESCARYLHDGLLSSRIPLLNPKYLAISPGSYQSVLCVRKFLRTVRIPAHRHALVRLLCADHPLAVEQLRRRRNPDGSFIEADCRPCRYCEASTESEVHALFRCEGPEDGSLVERRMSFLGRVDEIVGNRLVLRCTDGDDDGTIMAIHFFLEHDVLGPDFAKFVYDVLRIFPISAQQARTSSVE